MTFYKGTIEEFNEDILRNRIADRITKKYQAYYKKKPSNSEYKSWATSLAILNKSLTHSGLKDIYIVLEYELPCTSQRIDVMLFGHDVDGKENIVILELKQWSSEKVSESKSEGNVFYDYGKFIKEQPHPSLQVQSYYFGLKDFIKIFEEKNAPRLSAIVYAHNYSKQKNAVLFSKEFSEILKRFSVFTRGETAELGMYLKKRLQNGRGQVIYKRFARSPIVPSKKLLDHVSQMIQERQIFNLIDDQIVAYNAIMQKVEQLAKTRQKSIVIVKGGPGTGKSVLALEIMGELLRRHKKVFYATGSSAFTNTLKKLVGGERGKNLFKFLYNLTKERKNSIDVLICDEAHRFRKDSNDYAVPFKFRSKNPLVDDLIKTARLSIFFIDEYQIVRPNEVGNIKLIVDSAKKFGVQETNIVECELKTQFRCSGSDAYLQWLDYVLSIRDIEPREFDTKMEFRIFNHPTEMMSEIRKRNKEKPNSARITAGFCWSWSKPNKDGSLVNDVKVDGLHMPWERKDQFWKWATGYSGMEQIGTVYTAQGFEFDYIAVIFGNDLIYDLENNTWKAVPNNSCDTQIKHNNPLLVRHLKNVYRILMSRAHKGVYVYFMDKDTETYFRRHLP